MHIYCLFCQTQRAGAVARHLRAVLDDCQVMQPRIVQRKWVQGEPVREIRDYLPGYLFLFCEIPIVNFDHILQIDGVIRCLGYQMTDGRFVFAELEGTDRDFAARLYESDGLIDTVKVYKEGDWLTPAGGLLADMKGRIVKVNRRRQRLLMSFEFDGVTRECWVGFDVVEDKTRLPASETESNP